MKDHNKRRYSHPNDIKNSCRRLCERLAITEEGECSRWPPLPIPPFECFDSHISERRLHEMFEKDIMIGDILIVKVKRSDAAGAYVRPLCMASRIKRTFEYIHDIQIIVPISSLNRRLSVDNLLKVVVIQINPIQVEFLDQEVSPLHSRDLPEYFRNARDMDAKAKFYKYTETIDYSNPYLDILAGLPATSTFSCLPISNTNNRLTSAQMRFEQNKRMAADFTAKGVAALKEQNISKAMRHLEAALSVDSEHLDAYVARGAAYAVAEQHEKAEEDYDRALAINPDCLNAVQYMVETLLKLAIKLKANDPEAARKKYEKVLGLRDDQRARDGLTALDRKRERRPSIEEITIEASNGNNHEHISSSKRRHSREDDRKRRRDEGKRRSHAQMAEKRERDKKLAEFELMIAKLKEK